MRKIPYKTGMTLAELLLGVTILGLIIMTTVAVIDGPSKKHGYVAGLKKAYAQLDAATRAIVMDNGGTLTSVFSGFDQMRDEYGKYIKFDLTCDDGTDTTYCWSGTTYNYDGSVAIDLGISSDSIDNYSFGVGTDGVFYAFRRRQMTCDSNMVKDSLGNHIGCGEIVIDVNGSDSPNTFGIDIFGFHTAKDGLHASGDEGTWYDPDRNGTDPCYNATGVACTSQVLVEGDISYY